MFRAKPLKSRNSQSNKDQLCLQYPSYCFLRSSFSLPTLFPISVATRNILGTGMWSLSLWLIFLYQKSTITLYSHLFLFPCISLLFQNKSLYALRIKTTQLYHITVLNVRSLDYPWFGWFSAPVSPG